VLERDLPLKRTAEGELVVMPSTGGETSSGNALLPHHVTGWALRDGYRRHLRLQPRLRPIQWRHEGTIASWVRRERLADLTAEQKRKLLPRCPGFVVALRMV
jgi:hypothetical protein